MESIVTQLQPLSSAAAVHPGLLLHLPPAIACCFLAHELRVLADPVERTLLAASARTVVAAHLARVHDRGLRRTSASALAKHLDVGMALDEAAAHEALVRVDDLRAALLLKNDQIVPGHIPDAVDRASGDRLLDDVIRVSSLAEGAGAAVLVVHVEGAARDGSAVGAPDARHLVHVHELVHSWETVCVELDCRVRVLAGVCVVPHHVLLVLLGLLQQPSGLLLLLQKGCLRAAEKVNGPIPSRFLGDSVPVVHAPALLVNLHLPRRWLFLLDPFSTLELLLWEEATEQRVVIGVVDRRRPREGGSAVGGRAVVGRKLLDLLAHKRHRVPGVLHRDRQPQRPRHRPDGARDLLAVDRKEDGIAVQGDRDLISRRKRLARLNQHLVAIVHGSGLRHEEGCVCIVGVRPVRVKIDQQRGQADRHRAVALIHPQLPRHNLIPCRVRLPGSCCGRLGVGSGFLELLSCCCEARVHVWPSWLVALLFLLCFLLDCSGRAGGGGFAHDSLQLVRH
mmetsp:Transcript_9565/g.22659  ORF Transcript_9565/g.22659 Transcript_9565/m.22659 type:complete len:508 (+) Transcript_9565:388-1911(+)